MSAYKLPLKLASLPRST